MSENIGASIVEILLAIIFWILRAIGSIVKFVFESIASFISYLFKKNKSSTDAKTVHKIKSQIDTAIKVNDEMLSLSTNAFSFFKENNEEKRSIDNQCRYCNTLKPQLSNAQNNINQDISRLGDESFSFRKEKYNQILSVINGIRYSVDKKRLNEILDINSGWNRFIADVLSFAGVRGNQTGRNVWEYTKGDYRFHLCLDESSKKVNVSAKSVAPVKHLPSAKPINKPKDENAMLNFDDQNELVILLSRRIDEFDHYDVFEYFTSVDKWLAKKEINDYAGKRQLSVREAFDFKDNVPILLENCKKIAPPPADYLPDHEKTHGGKQRWAQYHDKRQPFFQQY